MNDVRIGNNLVPTRYQDAIDSGLRFFECRMAAQDNYSRSVANLLDVRVHLDSGVAGGYRVEWLSGDKAFVYYEALSGRNGRYVLAAFIPDDPCMYNKIALMESPELLKQFYQIHTRTGTFAAEEVKHEFDAMQRVLKVKSPALKLLVDGIEIDWAWKEDEERLANELETQCIKRKKKKGIEIVPWEALRYRPEILEMKKRWLRSPNKSHFGWMDCDEFRKVYIPQINKEIEKHEADSPTDQAKDFINKMTPDQIEAFAQALIAKSKEKKEKKEAAPKEITV